MKKFIAEVITLSSPRGRLVFISVSTAFLFLVPFKWLSNLSLWQRLGWDWAPSIGLTRSYWLFIHGKIDEAIAFNPLIMLVLFVASIVVAKDVYQLWTNRQRLRYTETKLLKER